MSVKEEEGAPSLEKPTRPTVLRILLGLVVIAGVLLAGEELRPYIPKTEAWIREQGIWAPVTFIVLLTILSLVCFPLDVLFIGGGLIFNLGWGFLYVVVGLYLGQSLAYALARTLLRERVRRYAVNAPRFRALNHAIEKGSFELLFLLRLAPLPTTPTSYLIGATGVPFLRFLLATLGVLPTAFASMYFGRAAVQATRATTDPHHTFTPHDALILGGLILTIAILAYIGHRARKVLLAMEKTNPTAG